MFKLQLGINKCTNTEYHSDLSWLSSSKLKTLVEDPAKFYDDVILGNAKNESKPQYELGSYVHTLVLEPEQEAAEYAVFQGWRKAGAAWEQFKMEHAGSGKTLLSVPQVEQGKLAQTALKARPEISVLLKGGEPEVSICSHILDVPVKKRSDYINVDKGYILDVKTTGMPSGVENFRRTVKDFRYDLSAALYAQIAYQHYGKLFDFYFAVYSKVDKQWDLYKASSQTLSEGAADVTKALVTYKKCMASGIWLAPDAQPVSIVPASDYIVEAV